jgi:hypothetical protein
MVDARVGKRANSGEYRLCGVARRSVGALVNRHPPDSRVAERDCPPDRGALQRNSIGADPLAPGSSRCPPQQRRNSWLCLDRGAILPSSTFAPGFHSDRTNRNGPEPIVSLTDLYGSVAASLARMITALEVPSAISASRAVILMPSPSIWPRAGIMAQQRPYPITLDERRLSTR